MSLVVSFCVYFSHLLTLSASYQQPLSVPKHIEGIKGGTITLTCVPPKARITQPTVLWDRKTEKGTENIATSVNGGSHISKSELENRTTLNRGNLRISSLQVSDSGTYTCTVTPYRSQILSATTRLTVSAKPQVSAFANTNSRVDSNDTYVAATCLAEFGHPRPTVKWKNEDGNIQTSTETTSQNSDETWNVRSDLILAPGSRRRLGNFSHAITSLPKAEEFTCFVEYEFLNSVERSTNKVIVNVLYAPYAFISVLGNRLTCHAEGNPRPSIEWLLPNRSILLGTSSVFLKQQKDDDGFYTCRAFSRLKPDSVATLDVQKARDLPVLFRTLVKLNTSLPTTASGYEITCSAEVVNSANEASSLDFEWTRNGKLFSAQTYEISTVTRQFESSLNSQLLSTMRFLDVVRDRDDAEFRCRLINRSALSGFVSAVERSISVSVDYASVNVRIQGFPADFVLKETEPLTLRCSDDSRPLSIKEWYFDGLKIGTGNRYQITEIHRSMSGVYRCMAHNYVPGKVSAYAEARVTVLYPPSNLIIRKLKGGRLSCEAKGGSLPPPWYSWIYPNGTIKKGNVSVIQLLNASPHKQSVYTCRVTNNIFRSSLNVSYTQLPLKIAKIGSLTVAEFSAALVAGILLFLAIVVAAGYFVYRRRIRTSKSAERTFRKYLNYADSPKNKPALSDERSSCKAHSFEKPDVCAHTSPNHNTSKRSRLGDLVDLPSNFKSDDDQNPVTLLNKKSGCYKCASDNPALECTPIAVPPQSCVRSIRDLSTPQSSSTKQFVDGSSIEITAVESLPSSTNPSSEQYGAAKPDETRTFDSRSTATKSENQSDSLEDCDPHSGNGALPFSVRLANIRKDVARQMQTQRLAPVPYTSQGTLPRAYIPRMASLNHPRSQPVTTGVFVSGYDPVLYDATWRPSFADQRLGRRYVMTTTEDLNIHDNPNLLEQKFTLLAKNFTDDLKRSRSMSLSASSSSAKSCSHFPEEEESNFDAPARNVPVSNPSDVETYSFSVAMSPFEHKADLPPLFSPNSLTKKPQSLTLV